MAFKLFIFHKRFVGIQCYMYLYMLHVHVSIYYRICRIKMRMFQYKYIYCPLTVLLMQIISWLRVSKPLMAPHTSFAFICIPLLDVFSVSTTIFLKKYIVNDL